MKPVFPFIEFKRFFLSKSVLSRLILINILVYLFINLVNLFLWLYRVPSQYHEFPVSRITWWLAVPAYLPLILEKPWTILTYMFVQEEFLHLLFNMIVLYFAGIMFNQYLNRRALVTTYLTGGFCGAVFYILAYNIFPVFADTLPYSMAIGASASVLSILVAVATFTPETRISLMFLGNVRMKYIALFLVVLDLLSIQANNPGGHIAHLGGALWGFIYVKLVMNKIQVPSFSGLFKRKKPAYKSTEAPKRPITDDEYNARKLINQARMDEILEKISKSGYEKLTKEEKEFLFKSGKKQ